jgi:hypothetical protein
MQKIKERKEKPGLEISSSSRAPASQAQSPEFKPHTAKKEYK